MLWCMDNLASCLEMQWLCVVILAGGAQRKAVYTGRPGMSMYGVVLTARESTVHCGCNIFLFMFKIDQS